MFISEVKLSSLVLSVPPQFPANSRQAKKACSENLLVII
jgi:hypothetical protein